MPPVYVTANRKGGQGKTTTAAEIVWQLSQRGLSVLAIDSDGQTNFSRRLGIDKDDPEAPGHTEDVLVGERTIEDSVIASRTVTGVDVLTATEALDLLDQDPEVVLRWSRLLPAVTRWDAVVIDTPPSANQLSLSAMIAATAVVAPTTCTLQGLEGMASLNAILTKAATLRPGARIDHVLPIKYDARRGHDVETLSVMHEMFPGRVLPPVRDNIAADDSYSVGKPFSGYRRSAAAAREYQAACRLIIAAHQ